jgi:hypothetical protein
MKLLGISEFTYGFAFLYEQTQANWDNLKAIPITPSLAKEGGRGGVESQGWDACLQLKKGSDFYYQFKMSDYLMDSRAKYLNKGPGTGPYYRFALHRKNNYLQHKSLRVLSKKEKKVFYVAPEFSPAIYRASNIQLMESLNRIFLNGEVTENSRLIPVSECKDCDVDDPIQHHMIYRTGYRAKIYSDDPFQIRKSFHGGKIEKLYRSSKFLDINDDFILGLFKVYTDVISEIYGDNQTNIRELKKSPFDLLNFDPKSARKEETLLRLSQICMVFFNSVLVLVGEPLPKS